MLVRSQLSGIRDQLDNLLDEAARANLSTRETLILTCEREIARRDHRRIEMELKLAHFPAVKELASFALAPAAAAWRGFEPSGFASRSTDSATGAECRPSDGRWICQGRQGSVRNATWKRSVGHRESPSRQEGSDSRSNVASVDQRTCADARQIGGVRARSYCLGKIRRRRSEPPAAGRPAARQRHRRDHRSFSTSSRCPKMIRVSDRDVRHDPLGNRGTLTCSVMPWSPPPSSTGSCTTATS
ncbi:ATP-binding protein [Bradyrhizobium sp. CW10]|uniref:ATP-binding protein n=1 Tax=Bradyrhizobium sp. CW10 TaxID=2782683 RepID=UPI0023DEB33B|nr:ATP-binding protein [Bradyrhizobium sp. CW10]